MIEADADEGCTAACWKARMGPCELRRDTGAAQEKSSVRSIVPVVHYKLLIVGIINLYVIH